MKRTFIATVGTENYLCAIMAYCGWSEVDRVATGGHTTEPIVLITFEGEPPLQPMLYIKVDNPVNQGWAWYYSYWMPQGYYTNKISYFFDQYARRIDEENNLLDIYTAEQYEKDTGNKIELPDHALQLEGEFVPMYINEICYR